VKAKWRFSSILRVPWRPVLAAGGSTTHKFDPDTGLVREMLDPPLLATCYGCGLAVVQTARNAHMSAARTGPVQQASAADLLST